jgi:dTDP-4-amino-4,6-dideoxygalactose transaminase
MQFRDLKKQYQVLKSEIDAAIAEVCTESNFISGHQVEELEAQLAEYIGTRHCVACANGTDALTLALMAFGISAGDAVFVPDFTFFATAECVSFLGATPVFVDVEKDTFNISSQSLEQAVSRVRKEGKLTPKCVIAVDLFGLPADYERIREITEENDLLLLEDGAQGFGGSIEHKKACSFGDISITSFFPSKPLGCYGDGGAIFTDNADYSELLNSLRVHGKGESKYDNVRIGMNSRLDTIQAAILQVKLKAFKEYELNAVQDIAKTYDNLLSDNIIKPIIPRGFMSSFAQYTIQLPDAKARGQLQTTLKSYEIPTIVYYPKPLHAQAAFRDIIPIVDLSAAADLSETVVSLPMHPYLTAAEIEQICAVVNDLS